MKWVSNIFPKHENRLPPCPVRPNPAKVRDNVFVWSVRAPWTPLDLPSFNLNYEKTSFCEKLDFPRFINRRLVIGVGTWLLLPPTGCYCNWGDFSSALIEALTFLWQKVCLQVAALATSCDTPPYPTQPKITWRLLVNLKKSSFSQKLVLL